MAVIGTTGTGAPGATMPVSPTIFAATGAAMLIMAGPTTMVAHMEAAMVAHMEAVGTGRPLG
jgi:hypothetical protein